MRLRLSSHDARVMKADCFLDALIYFLLEGQELLKRAIENTCFERWPRVALTLKLFVDHVPNIRRISKILLPYVTTCWCRSCIPDFLMCQCACQSEQIFK